MTEKIVAIIQARMGSSRLPGKIMMNLQGKTVLEHVTRRMQKVGKIDEIIIATTTDAKDDVVVEEAGRLGVLSYRGSEEDVLSRYYNAALEREADVIIRITSDCPVIDPGIVDSILSLFLEQRPDYASNTLERSFPRGLDAEVFSMKALKLANEMADHPEQREHVTLYMYRHPDKFRLLSLQPSGNESKYRWTLDTPEDWKVIQAIYDSLYLQNPYFTWKDILGLVREHPELHEWNAHIEQTKLKS